MTRTLGALLVLGTLGAFAASCDNEDATPVAWFEGHVYDGSLNKPLTEYAMQLTYRDQSLVAKVDAKTGRFLVGPVPIWNDYTIAVTDAAGTFRAFESRNPMIGRAKNDAEGTPQTLYWDVYVFPKALTAPAATIYVTTTDSTQPTDGKLTLRPQTRSSLEVTPGSITGQVWTNDLDLLQESLTVDVKSGRAEITAGSTIYGVAYDVSIHSMAGFAPLASGPGTPPFVAGTTISAEYVVSPQTDVKLILLYSNASTCQVPAIVTTAAETSTINLTMNVPVELVGTVANANTSLNYGLSVTSTDGTNASAVAGATDKGAKIAIAGNVVTLTWKPANVTSLAAADPIKSVHYGNLASVTIQPVGKPGQAKTLAALVGGSSVSCPTP